jgi:hypothetical protein
MRQKSRSDGELSGLAGECIVGAELLKVRAPQILFAFLGRGA